MKNQMAFQVKLDVPYEQAVEQTAAALKEEGFGVLTEIDVKATLKEKLDLDFKRYVILGACNPPLAHQALESEEMIGLLLPCNVTIAETEGGSLVSILNPEMMLNIEPLGKDPAVKQVTGQAAERLLRVAAALSA
ncbi:MAG: DUF302 domain-containing protein [Anaerolineales bacterium]|nr:DUF302 domain-containing protein [Anaerolineales bacterium]